MEAVDIEMSGVREHAEGYSVHLKTVFTAPAQTKPRLVVCALSDGLYQTQVDLLDVIAWVKAHRPELLGDRYET